MVDCSLQATLDPEGTPPVSTTPPPPVASQDTPPQVHSPSTDRPRKILGSGITSSGGVKKAAPARQPPPDSIPAELPVAPAELPPPDFIPTELPTEEQPPVESIPPPFPARPKRSAPKAPSASVIEAPAALPPPPPPLDEVEPDSDSITEPEQPDPPKAVWVASGHHSVVIDPRPRVRAVFDYEAQAEGQLTFSQGAIMYVVERTSEGYMGCEYNGAIGWVINSYIEEIGVEIAPTHRPAARQTTQLQLGVHHQQPVSPRQETQAPAEVSPRQAAPKPVKQAAPQRPAPQKPPPPPSTADDGDEDVGAKLDQLTTTGPRLANPKRAGPRKGARPPTRGVQPKIKTKTTTDDAATGPRADLSALASSGTPASVGEDGAVAPRRVIAPGGPSMNIAALAVDQKGKLKNVQQRESVAFATPTSQQERAQFKAQFATTAGSYTPPAQPAPTEEDKSKDKEKKSKGLFGILGGKKKKDKS